jgi:hypothetical protein
VRLANSTRAVKCTLSGVVRAVADIVRPASGGLMRPAHRC